VANKRRPRRHGEEGREGGREGGRDTGIEGGREGEREGGRKGGREGGRGAHAPKSEKELGNGLDDVLVKNVRDNECHASIIPPAVREKEGAEEAKLGNGVVGGIDSLGDGGRS
jgi:hypothetical protein